MTTKIASPDWMGSRSAVLVLMASSRAVLALLFFFKATVASSETFCKSSARGRSKPETTWVSSSKVRNAIEILAGVAMATLRVNDSMDCQSRGWFSCWG